MAELRFEPGEHIDSAAARLIAALAFDPDPHGRFNDITISAKAGDTADAIVARWDVDMAARSEAYRKSPEGIASARAQTERTAALQATADRLMFELLTLDFSNDSAVLAWCEALQEPSDHCGAKLARDVVLGVFRAHGFESSVNCGPDFDGEDRENMFRYLVGQAMAGLEGPAIHPILHRFAADWRAKFGVA